MASGRVELLLALKTQGADAVGKIRSDLDSLASGKTTQRINKSSASLDRFNKTAARGKKAGKDLRATGKDFDRFSNGLDSAAKTAQLIDGPLGGVAARITTLKSAVGSLNPVLIAAAFAIGGTLKVLKDSVFAAADLEKQMLTLNGVIAATGAVAGLSAEEIDGLSRALDKNTLFSAEGARQAAGVLLTFKSIQGDTFKRALTLSSDLAAVMGGDLRQASLQLAKALEEPEIGLNALRRSGVSFTDSQKELIKSLVETGNAAAAQNIILDALEGQVGGTAERAGEGLAGAIDEVSFRWTNFLEQLSETSGAATLAEKGIRLLNEALEFTTFALEELDNLFDNVFGGDEAEEQISKVRQQVLELRSQLETLSEGGTAAKLTKEMIKQLETQQEISKVNKEAIQAYLDAERAAERLGTSVEQLKSGNFSETVRGFVGLFEEAERQRVALFTGGNEDLVEAGKAAYEQQLKLDAAFERKRIEQRRAAEREALEKQQAEREKVLSALAAELDTKEQSNESALAQKRLEGELEILEQRKSENLVALEEYYDERLSLEIEKLDEQEKAVIAKQEEINGKLAEEQQRIAEINAAARENSDDPIEITRTEELLKLQQEQRDVAAELGKLSLERADTITALASAERQALTAQLQAQQKVTAELEKRQSQDLTFNATVDSDELKAEVERAKVIVAQGYESLREQARKAFPAGGDAESQAVIDGLVQRDQVAAEFDTLKGVVAAKIAEIKRLRASFAAGEVETFAEVGETNDQINRLQGEVNALIPQMETLAETDPGLAQKFDEAKRSADAASESTMTLSNFLIANGEQMAQSFAGGLSNAILDFVNGTKSAEDAFRQFAATFLAQIAQMILQQAILNGLKAAFGASGGGFFGGPTAATGGYIPVQNFATGGKVRAFDGGGRVRGPGTSLSDSIPARLSAGEYVIKAAAVRKYGVGFFELLNKMALDWKRSGLPQAGSITMPKMKRFNTGGYVNSAADNAARKDALNPNSGVDLQIINTIDPSDVVNKALSSPGGRKTLLNFMSSNKEKIRASLR